MEFHPIANIFPMMGKAELQELADDIKANGLLEPIITWQDKILDGRNRYVACELADVSPKFTEWENGHDPVTFIVSKNLKRRHLDASQRAMVAARLETLRHGQRADLSRDANLHVLERSGAASLLGVSPRSVASAKSVLDNGVPELIAAVESGEIAVSHAAEIAQNPPEIQKETIKRPHVTHNSGNNEWYTPPEYIEAAKSVMGGIDLDPASTEEANTVVRASKFYSIANDGLSHKWRGRVWLNPPYSSDLVGKFIDKLIEHIKDGSVTQAIVLVNNATETSWFCSLVDNAAKAVVFTRTRIRFWKTNGESGAPLQGQALLYFGERPKTFVEKFRHLGWGVIIV